MKDTWLSAPAPEQVAPFQAPASSGAHRPDRGFEVGTRLETERGLGRTGVIHTAHGTIATPAFIPVGTKANVKALTPEMVRSLGAQAVLANAYHLYLQPGSDIVDEAGGFASFMNWAGPTYTDSGGFQVLSLGAGFKKVLSQEFSGHADPSDPAVQMQAIKASNAVVDDDGVVFSSHIDGTKHRFTPEVSMGIQHQLGADIMFAFDELTSLLHPRGYQVESLERTHAWARRCLATQVLPLGALDNAPQLLVGLVGTLLREALVLGQTPRGPRMRALERLDLVATRVQQGRQLVESEHDIGTQLMLNTHRHFGVEAMLRAIDVAGEHDAIVINNSI